MPNETSLLNDIASLNNTNSATDNNSANNDNAAAKANLNKESKPPLTRHIIFTLLPVNMIFALPIYYFTNFENNVSWQTFNYMFVGYIVVFLLLYGLITRKLYPKVTSKAWLVSNIFNLAFSLLINYFIDMFSRQSDWYIYPLSITQNLILIWAMLLLWQGLMRFWAWVKYAELNSEQNA